MFSRFKITALVLIFLLATGILSFIGCDDRNEADIPKDVYSYAATYTAGSIIKHVAADGDYAAIAATFIGARVLDVSNLDSIHEVYALQPNDGIGALWVGISSDFGLVVSMFDSSGPPYGLTTIYNFKTDEYVASTAFSGPFEDLAVVPEIESDMKSVYIWATDRLGEGDGLVGRRFCYDETDSSWFFTGCPFISPSYAPERVRNIRGFGIKGNLFAIALTEDGIHIEEVLSNVSKSDLYTPGIAYDCAWYGDYIVVADRYFVTIVNAADPENPVIVNNMIIAGADRLFSVVVSDHYAVLLDEFDGAYILDLSDPVNPVMVQEIRLNEPTSVAVDGDRLYITDEQAGLLIYTR